jgi:hypothetical protein
MAFERILDLQMWMRWISAITKIFMHRNMHHACVTIRLFNFFTTPLTVYELSSARKLPNLNNYKTLYTLDLYGSRLNAEVRDIWEFPLFSLFILIDFPVVKTSRFEQLFSPAIASRWRATQLSRNRKFQLRPYRQLYESLVFRLMRPALK